MKKYLTALCLAFCYAPEVIINKLSGDPYELPKQLSNWIWENIPPGIQLAPETLLPQQLNEVLYVQGLRQKFSIIDHSPSEERLELQIIYAKLNIEQHQEIENWFYVSRSDIKNGQQFMLRFEPYDHDDHVPGLSDDDIDKLNPATYLKLLRPYGFKLSYSANSPIQPQNHIRFWWESNDTETGNEYWGSDRAISLYELFHSQSLGTLNIKIPYHWNKSFDKQIKSNLQTEPDHFANFVDTIDLVISELKKIAEKGS